MQALGDYDFRPTSIEAASAHLRSLLQDKAALLVVDDVWDPAHVLIWQIGGPHSRTLITTRRADVAEEVVISHDAGVSLSEDSVMITVVIRKE